jgi:preprotein translocase subunit SecF
MIEIIKNPKINFLKVRYISFFISSIFVILGIIGVIRIVTGTANLGIDFSGGSLISIKFEKPVLVENIRRILRENNLSDKNVQQIPAENKIIIRLKKGEVEIGKAVEKIKEIFTKSMPDIKFEVDRNEEIGPAVGSTLQKQAIQAIIIALIGILIYIWWRFEFRFSIGATVATIHDVLVVLGIMIALNKEFSLLLITALLTLAGYSLTDTVVVFDRIRLNLKLRPKTESYFDCVNRSINEVLSRTIMTSLTTIITVLMLMILGGEVIHDFALAMFLGIIVGTYSSIFIASAIVVEWQLRSKKA